MSPSRLVVLSLVCSTGCTTYTVRKAALAPHAAPPMRNGQNLMGASAEAAVGASALARSKDPIEGPDADAGLYIPRVEVVAALRKRVSADMDLGLLYDHGFRRGAVATSEDIPEPRNGSVYGGGVTGFYSVPTGTPGLRVGIGLDLLLYSVPYVEYTTATEGSYSRVDHDRDSIGVYSLAVVPSWSTGRFTLFGGGTVRNHPTIEKGEVEGGIDPLLDSDDDVESGPPNFILHAGIDVELGQGIRAMAMVYQPIDREPVDYAPTLGVGLTLPLGRYREPKREPPPPPSPYVYPPQPYPYPPPQPYPYPPPQPYPYPPPQPQPQAPPPQAPPPQPQPAPPPPAPQ